MPGLGGLDLRELLEALLPGVRFVWVRRDDTARQAVSLWTAIQTGSWRSGQRAAGSREPRYSFAALEHLRARLVAEDAAWGCRFAEHDIAPLELHYGRFAGDLDAAVRAVLMHAGAEPPAGGGARVPMRRQAAGRSERWVERFRRELKNEQRRLAAR